MEWWVSYLGIQCHVGRINVRYRYLTRCMLENVSYIEMSHT